MQMMAPPEDALTKRFARIDDRFDEVNRRITEGKEETNRRFDRVEGDISDLKKSVAKIQESVASIQATLTRVSFGLALTFASVLITKGF